MPFAGVSLGGERRQRVAIGLGAARAAIKARHGDFVELGKDADVGFEHAADVELEGGERGDKIATKLVEARHIAGDQRSPLARVTMRERSGLRLFEPESIAFAQTVEDDGLGPLEQAGQGFVSVGLRQRLFPLEEWALRSRPATRIGTRRLHDGGGILGTAQTARNSRNGAYSARDDAKLTRGAHAASLRATSRSASSNSARR